VTRLADAVLAVATPAEQLRALSKHHHEHGGGLRWFREQAGKLVPLVPDTDIAATDYRFRLRPLARLAAQCGVTNMNQSLDAISQVAEELQWRLAEEP
jgi:metal-dependent hydrolase (beta-lactamase superfamily II)